MNRTCGRTWMSTDVARARGGMRPCRLVAGLYPYCSPLPLLPCSRRLNSPPISTRGYPPAERAHDLVGRMTLDEKAAQLEDWATSIPRLGIPDYQTWNEALHGVARAGYATVFPQAIGMAATWDPTMVHGMGNVDLHRGPRQIQPGPARRQPPHLLRTHLLVAQHQHLSRSPLGPRPGDLRRRPVPHRQNGRRLRRAACRATISTICAPSPPASTSPCTAARSRCATASTSTPRPRDLEETYLPAFRATVTEGHVQSVMCAYNSIDGWPACTNKMLLKEHLRDAWGFKGFVVSDCGAIVDVNQGHKKAPTSALRRALAEGRHRPLVQYLDAGIQHAGRRGAAGAGFRRSGDPGRRTPLYGALPAWSL